MYQIEYEMLTKSEWSNEFDDVCMIHECDYNEYSKCILLYGIIDGENYEDQSDSELIRTCIAYMRLVRRSNS